MSAAGKVYIRELGPREGFQTLPTPVPTADKCRLIAALAETGVQEIEITSLVRPDKVPQMADAEQIITSYPRKAGIRFTGLYLNEKGFERAEASGRLDNQAWLYSAMSETFLRKNNNTSRAEILAAIPGWLTLFKNARKPLHGVMISTAFGCNYEGAITIESLSKYLREIRTVLDTHGVQPKEISLADTMGWGTPDMVRRRVATARDIFSKSDISLHLHDTRGTGMANVYAGLLEGVRIFDASVGGLGGCPFARGAAGNVPTEDVVFLCEESGFATGISLERYCTAAELAESITGVTLPGKYFRSFRALQKGK